MTEFERVAVFWDYENCAPPSNSQGFSIVDSIRSVAHDYGSIQVFKAYAELSQSELSSKTLTLRSELQYSGVSLTDCPHNGKKEVADKMMIVDMMTFAIDTPPPATIIIISGDRDFTYATSILRMRRYRVILIAPTASHISLKRQASTVLDWEELVGRRAPRPSFDSTDSTLLSDARNEFRRNILLSDSPATPSSPKPTKRSRANSARDSQSAPRSKLGHGHSISVDFVSEHVTFDKEEIHIHDNLAPTPGPSNFSSERPTGTKTNVRKDHEDVAVPKPSEPLADIGYFLNQVPRTSYDSSQSDYQTAIASSEASSSPAPVMPSDLGLSSTEYHTAASNLSERPQKSDSILHPTPRAFERVVPPARPATTEPLSRLDLDRSTLPTPFQDVLYAESNIAQNNVPTEAYAPVESDVNMSSRTVTEATASGVCPPPLQPPSQPVESQPTIRHSPPVPAHFLALIQILEEFRIEKKPRPHRGTVAMKLRGQCKNVYDLAGVASWKDYAILAQRAGFVVLGGMEGDAWITLHPDWHGRVPPLQI